MKICELLGMVPAGESITIVIVGVIALLLTVCGGRILEYLKRRSNAHPCESQVSRHREATVPSRAGTKLPNP
jgi:hypothetical protein